MALRPVSERLMQIPAVPACDPVSKASYSTDEVIAYGKCWRAAYDALFTKHKGLINAVAVRQRAAAKAVKMAKS